MQKHNAKLTPLIPFWREKYEVANDAEGRMAA